MTEAMRRRILWGGLALVLLVCNGLIIAKERLLASGETVLLELAPRDPRSIMQGDYMRLRYSLVREINNALGDQADVATADGYVIATLDEDKVARFQRLAQSADEAGPSEVAMLFRIRGGRIKIASDAFFFQEGFGEFYESARYGEVKVSPGGDVLLVGLRDREKRPLQPALLEAE
ncbi:GDYXXLXY domain-containing protein [Hahella aquimaris]|uniref:GDYXXLXY domain-containing protein n=1 Tax=Hahella sp. HNIBRBA332 TaxID=3015983 RepID=UPI00273BE629|nr:GDYXXLXY domain-containing protein [Hahella sp. HNIBRBA332]WLQ12375.1 GDYXXLXY domain-containing protein [Hahella sp. HNIBRBA332]